MVVGSVLHVLPYIVVGGDPTEQAWALQISCPISNEPRSVISYELRVTCTHTH